MEDEFKVMLFELCNVPASILQLTDLVQSGLNWTHCLVFFNDLVVLGAIFESHLQNLQAVIQRLGNYKLRVKPSKCSFLRRKVNFLGHVVSRDEISTSPSKIAIVVNWSEPKLTKVSSDSMGWQAIKNGLRLALWIVFPLLRLSEKNAVFLWTMECETAFPTLRHYLISSPVLAYLDFPNYWSCNTNASNAVIGGVMSQGPDGMERVIEYTSQVLSKAVCNYCVIRQELLETVYHTQHFRLTVVAEVPITNRPWVAHMVEEFQWAMDS